MTKSIMRYSIKDLEKLSGIQAHTIRIWEQRYDLLIPERSETNIRSYSDDQARKLLNVVTLMEKGLKISKIAKLTEEEVNNEIQEIIDSKEQSDIKVTALINQMIDAGLTLNASLFNQAFASTMLSYDLKEAYANVLYPMLVKIGLMWNKNDIMPVQEHFISNYVKQKLFSSINDLKINEGEGERWILFLPEGEFHEMGLLMASYLLKLKGHEVIYLGQSVPYDSLSKNLKFSKPDHLLFFTVTHKPKRDLKNFINKLSEDFPNIGIVSCTRQAIDTEGITNKKLINYTSIDNFV